MIESMVVGTPVIALALGSTKEVIQDQKTGFLCQNVGYCISALDRVKTLDRKACRDHVVSNFSASHMVDQYEAIYKKFS